MISVIIPVYNVSNYLDECIDSIVNQSYRDIEIIMIDDGSTDNSGKKCDEWAEKDSRIIVIHKENGGLSSARNAGLDIARGEFIMFADSDDYYEAGAIELMHSIIEGTNVDIVVGNGKYVDENGIDIKEKNVFLNNHEEASYEIISEENFWDRYTENVFFVTVFTKIYKKHLFDSIRFPIGKINEDDAVLYKLISSAKSYAVTGRPIYNYRVRMGSIMNSSFGDKNLFLPEVFLEQDEYIKGKPFTNLVKFKCIWRNFNFAMNLLGEGLKCKKTDKIVYSHTLKLCNKYKKEAKYLLSIAPRGKLFIKEKAKCFLLIVSVPLYFYRRDKQIKRHLKNSQ